MNTLVRLCAAGMLIGAAAFSVDQALATEIPVATWGSPNHINVSTFVAKLEEVVSAESGGKITVKHYPSGQLAEDADMPVAIPAGKVKLGWITLNNWSGMAQDVKIADAPTGLTMEQMAAATDGDDGIKAVLDRQLRAKGVALLAVTNLGPTVIVTKDAVLSPADLAGKKLRVYSEGTAALVQALGASPVQLPFADIYTALQRGTIDGAIVGFQGIGSQKLHEVVSNVLVPASFTGTGYQAWAANLGWWEGLPESERAIVAKAIRKAELYSREKIIEDREKLADSYRDLGMTVTDLTPGTPDYAAWIDATRPLMEAAERTLSPEVLAPVKKQLEAAN
jgi:TRAP-type C4-dicarboxylate transport system substrate-binding protein